MNIILTKVFVSALACIQAPGASSALNPFLGLQLDLDKSSVMIQQQQPLMIPTRSTFDNHFPAPAALDQHHHNNTQHPDDDDII